MVVEYIRYRIAQDRVEEFVKAYEAAGEPLRESPHCLSYEVSQCTEDPEQFIVRMLWDSVDGHRTGFRGSPQFRRFFPLVQPFFEGIQEMRHYEPVVSHEHA